MQHTTQSGMILVLRHQTLPLPYHGAVIDNQQSYTHRENIKRKLDAANAGELTRSAVQWILENG